jgi:hypothetical protein
MAKLVFNDAPAPGPKTGPGDAYNPYVLSDLTRRGLPNMKSMNMSDKELKSYIRQDVYVTPHRSKEDLDKERAENQGWFGQATNAVMQGVTNEVILGSALGLSNVFDGIKEAISSGEENDYTNSVSTWLEQQQEAIKERFAIYQKDPNQSWAITDFGWWANGFVNIASTASMLFPSVGIVKGVSAAGRLMKANRITLGAAKALKGVGVGKSAIRNYEAINQASQIGSMALLSRTMENYMEARGVYQEVYDDTLNKLNNATEEEKQAILDRNPDFEGKSNEDLARHIASVGADKTFVNDYGMLLMDIVQFKQISALYKGIANKTASYGLKNANRAAIAGLAGTTDDAAKVTVSSILKDRTARVGSYFGKIEFTEGVEEIYQGIQTEKGKEVGEQYFNPDQFNRSLGDYLSDGAILEQGFWGILGGMGFHGLSTGLGNLSKKIRGAIDKSKLTPEQYASSQLTDEKIRTTEIQGRQAKMQQYVENMKIVDAGRNPFKYKIDPVTKERIVTDGNPEFETLSDEEVIDVKRQLTDDFITNMTLEATDVGNYDLLKEFVTNSEFNKYFERNGMQDLAGGSTVTQELLAKMDSIYDDYSKYLSDVLINTEVNNEYVAKAVARQNIRRQLNITRLQEDLGDVNNEIQQSNNTPETIDAYTKEAYLNYYNKVNASLDKSILGIDSAKNISKQAKEAYKKQLNDRKKQLKAFAISKGINVDMTEEESSQAMQDFYKRYNEFKKANEVTAENTGTAKRETRDAIIRKIALEDNIDYVKSTIANTQEKLNADVEEISKFIDAKVIEKFEDAVDKVGAWIEAQPNLDTAFDAVYNDRVPELKDYLDILKIGHRDTNQFTQRLYNIAAKVETERERQAERESVTTSDGQQVSEVVAEDIRENVPDVSSTGEEVVAPETPPVEETAFERTPIAVENPAEVVTPNDDYIEVTAAELDKAYEDRNLVIEEQNYLGSDQQYFKITVDIIFDIWRTSRNLFNDVIGKDVNSAEMNKLIDVIADELYMQGAPVGRAKGFAVGALTHIFPIISEGTKISEFEQLGRSLATGYKLTFDVDTGMLANTTRISTQEELNPIIEQFLDSYIKANDVGIAGGVRTTINIPKLFDFILNNPGLSFNQAKYIYKNIAPYIYSYKGNKYKFTVSEGVATKRFIKDIIDNPEAFFERLAAIKTINEQLTDRIRIANPNENRNDAVTNQINTNARNAVRSGDTVEAITNSNDPSISLRFNGGEVGFLVKVKMSNDGNTLSLVTQERGFAEEVTKTSDGLYTSNFDELFLAAIRADASVGFDKIRKHAATYAVSGYEATTAEMAKEVLNNPLIEKYIANNKIKFPKYIVTDIQKANMILSNIAGVVFYDRNAETQDMEEISYLNWKQNKYNNYKQTLDIQTSLERGEKVNVKVSDIDLGKTILDPIGNEIDSIGLTYEQNPVVAITADGRMIVEGKTSPYTNYLGFSPGVMGMLIRDNPNAPVIAKFTEANYLRSNDALTNQVGHELYNIIDSYSRGKLTFDNLYRALFELMGGPREPGTTIDNLFTGYSVMKAAFKDNDVISLNVNGEKGRYALTFFKYRKTAFGKEIGTGIYYNPNGDMSNENRITILPGQRNNINQAVNEILDNLKFNKTFFMVRNNNINDARINRYIYKENGKTVIEIGGVRTEYESFGHFILDNNAFKTSQGVNDRGEFFTPLRDVKTLYVSVETEQSPINTKAERTSIRSVKDILESSTKTNPIDTLSVLNSAGIPQAEIDILNGTNEAGIKLIPDEVYYDKNLTNAYAMFNNGKIYLSPKFITAIRRSPKEAIRFIVHENIHAQFEKSGVMKQANLVNDLLFTYKEFVAAINIDLANNPVGSEKHTRAKNLADWIKRNNFDPVNYGSSLGTRGRERFNARTQEERERIFAEEWLVESITQGGLIEFLNEHKSLYDTTVPKNADKTIWQKIIEVLAKLFNKSFANIKNNSILARQYSLLGDVGINTESLPSAEEIEEDTDESPVEETPIEDDNLNDFDDDSLYSTTESIEDATEGYIDSYNNNNEFSPTGISTISDMASIVPLFDEQDKQAIAALVNKNEVKFICS